MAATMTDQIEPISHKKHKKRHRESDRADRDYSSRKKARTEDWTAGAQDEQAGPKSERKRKHRNRENTEGRRQGFSARLNGRHHTRADVKPARPNTTSPPSDTSPFISERRSLYLPVLPITLSGTIEGLCMIHLSPNLLKYYPPVSGVLLAYSDPKVSEECPDSPEDEKGLDAQPPLILSAGEYGEGYIWLTATFTIFRPFKSCVLQGRVNLFSRDHIGLIIFNFWGASIDRRHLPKEWKWISGESRHGRQTQYHREDTSSQQLADAMDSGHWVDKTGEKVQGELEFECLDVDVVWEKDHTNVSIMGTLLGDEQGDGARMEKHNEHRDKWREKRQNERRKGGKPQEATRKKSGQDEGDGSPIDIDEPLDRHRDSNGG